MDRDEARAATFERDNYKCVFCGDDAVDAHHLIERRLWTDGGYHLDNLISVCQRCHILCEQTVLSVEDARLLAGISNIIVPEHMYIDVIYDKWGNVVLEDGTRAKGELYSDPSVQQMLRDGGVIDDFVQYVKYPRTYHLPWSHPSKDDRVLHDLSAFEGKMVVVTEKMDGECTSLYNDYIHARSIDSSGHPSRDWIKQWWFQRAYELPYDWRVCGENLFAQHSIHYDDLESYFYGFSVWDRLKCFSWSDTIEWFQLLDIVNVPVLYYGLWDEVAIREMSERWSTKDKEGFVVRVTDSFYYSQFRTHTAKYVRPQHVTTDAHWRNHWQQNNLKETV